MKATSPQINTEKPAEIDTVMDGILGIASLLKINHSEETKDHKLSFTCDTQYTRFHLKNAIEGLMSNKHPNVDYKFKYNAGDLILKVIIL